MEIFNLVIVAYKYFMLVKTQYNVTQNLLQEAKSTYFGNDFRTSINKPTGNFFYDPWVIKDEYKDTVWDKLLSSIIEPIGEARIIILEPTKSYHAHADIDNRFHLNICGEESYLVDLDFKKTHKLETDGCWYDMDAGRIHTASNYGRTARVQLVVRQLLTRGALISPVHVRIKSNIPTLDDSRFVFDNTVSPWLNNVNAQGSMDNFSYSPTVVEFDLEERLLTELVFILGDNFRIE